MTQQSETAPTPTLTPHLICAGGLDAIEFYKKAFNAVEVVKLVGPTGVLIHAGLRIGNSMLMLAEECPEYGSVSPKTLKNSAVFLHLIVENADAAMEQAVAAGATITMPASDMFWGDRYGQLIDPFGHRWSIAHPIRNVSPEEMQAAATKMFEQQQNC